MCVNTGVMPFTYLCLNRQLTLGRPPVFTFLILIGGTLCFILYSQWIANFGLQGRSSSILQTSLYDTTSVTKVDRATCCLHSNQSEDICGRSNCTSSCTEPRDSIPELKNNHTRYQHLSQNKENAFLIETTGNGALNYRQACAVESLALHNPNLTVNVFFTDAKINNSFVTLQKLVEKYANVQFFSLDVSEFMTGALMEHWYHCTDWRRGSFHVNNLSNALRLLTVYKYGGYYFDLDVISVRPVTYYRNFVAAESENDVNSDVIHADLKNSFIELAIKDFVINFRPDLWGNNGPVLVFRVLQKWCNAEKLNSMDYISCRGFNILPASSFHPVHYGKIKELFVQPIAKETESISWLTEKMVGVHTWNKLSKDTPIYKNATHAYNRLARDNCPLTFSLTPEIF